MNKEKLDRGKPQYVGFQGRMFATVIDLFLSLLILLPFATAQYPQEVIDIFNQLASGEITEYQANKMLQDYMIYGGGLSGAFSNMIFEFLIVGIGVVLFWVYRSGTPGKMYLKMKIVDADTLSSPSTLNLAIRYLGYLISGVPLFIGFFSISWNKKHQGWHDRIANTVVIYEGDPPVKRFVIAMVTIVVILTLIMLASR